jgi:hypothetical protein
MKVQCDADGDSLEAFRPHLPAEWTYIADVEWGEDIYHQGDISYRMAQTGPNTWVMEAVRRNACLDDVTEEDVEQGRLNDDQIQALWNMTLQEAQSQEFCRIVAVCEGGDEAAAKAAMLKALGVQGGGGEGAS